MPDSIVHNLDSIRENKLSVLDTAEKKVNEASTKIQNLNHSLTDYDTLYNKIPSAQTEIDKRKNKLQSKIDSLQSLGLPHETYTRKLDSLVSLNPSEKLQEATHKVNEVQGKINDAESKLNDTQSKIDQIQNKPESELNKKLNVLSTESKGMGTLPSNVNLPDGGLPANNLPETDLKQPGLPSVDTPRLGLNDNSLKTDLDLKVKTPEITQPGEVKGLKNIQEKVDENLGSVTQKVGGYNDDIKNISKGNIDEVKTLKEDAIAQASMEEEIKALKQGEAAMAEQKAALEAMKNQEAYKKQMLSRARDMALKNIAARDLAIQTAVQKVNKYHKRAGTILQNKKDLPKKRDPLRKLKFYEKIVPGITLQLYKSDAWLADVNPSVRYRLTSYWSLGSGWNQRFMIGKSKLPAEHTNVYGLRTFSEIIIFKGLAMRFDVERMNSFVAPLDLAKKDEGQREWGWSYFAGLKKEFTFMPRVVGNVQFTYNVYNSTTQSPYPTRFNVRFGFEYSMKKKKRKNQTVK